MSTPAAAPAASATPATPPTPAAAPAPKPAPSGKTVAYENFQAVVTAKQGLEARVEELQGQLQTLTEKAATADTLAAQVGEWKQKAEQAGERFSVFSELSGVLGTTDTDVIETFDAKYRALPAKDRPARRDWIETLRADAAKAPAVLQPWLAAPANGNGGGPPRPAPRAVGGTNGGGPPSAPSAVSKEEVARVRAACIASGDWTAWKELKKANPTIGR